MNSTLTILIMESVLDGREGGYELDGTEKPVRAMARASTATTRNTKAYPRESLSALALNFFLD